MVSTVFLASKAKTCREDSPSEYSQYRICGSLIIYIQVCLVSNNVSLCENTEVQFQPALPGPISIYKSMEKLDNGKNVLHLFVVSQIFIIMVKT